MSLRNVTVPSPQASKPRLVGARARALDARLIAAGALLAVSLAGLATVCVILRLPMADALVYRAEGAAVVNGTDLYGFTVTKWDLPATYPPFAAILFVPTTWLPIWLLKVVFIVGNVALLALLVHLSCRLAGLPARPWLPFAATALGLWLEPVFQTLLFGQINLALACLVLWDLSRPDSARGKGIALGIATGIKLTPAIFICYLLLTGRTRASVNAIASFVGTVLLGILILPRASLDFWTRRMFQTERVGKAWIIDNQALQGLVSRFLHSGEPSHLWVGPAALAAVAGLWLARRAYRGGSGAWGDAWGIQLTALTALLVSPISWSHHWVWCVPLLALLLGSGRPVLAAAVALVFTARSFWILPHDGLLDLTYSWWEQLLASPYAVLSLGLFVWVAVASGIRRGRPAGRLVNQARPAIEDEPEGRSAALSQQQGPVIPRPGQPH